MAMLRTVLGDVAPEKLLSAHAMCLIHEHIQIDLSHNKGPQTVLAPTDLPDIISDLIYARTHHQLCAVGEMSVPGSGRNIRALADVARDSGVHIIAATGYYWDPIHPDNINGSVKSITDFMIREINEGAEGTSSRCGVIKIGTDVGDPPDAARRMFEAAANASRETLSAIVTHTSTPDQAQWQIDTLHRAGADLSRVLISHLHGLSNKDELYAHARRGVKIGFDQVGFAKGPRFTDYADIIAAAVHAGFQDHIMISSDVARHVRLMRSGGTSYSTVFDQLVPLLHARGLSHEIVQHILSHNPLNFLAQFEG
jgi:phosphotriesterase-related protein